MRVHGKEQNDKHKINSSNLIFLKLGCLIFTKYRQWHKNAYFYFSLKKVIIKLTMTSIKEMRYEGKITGKILPQLLRNGEEILKTETSVQCLHYHFFERA